MKRSRWQCVIMLLAGAVFAVGLSTAVAAQDCEQVVNDQAGLFGNQQAAVEAAANTLMGLGAEVRVVTLPDLGGRGNLDLVKEGWKDRCPSWQSPSRHLKSNLVVLMIAKKERKAGIYCGSTYLPRLTEDMMGRIRTERMNPKFQAGDFAGGFIAAMDAIGNVITVTPQPTASAPPVVVNVPQQASPPADLSGLWKFLGWLLGLGVIAAVVLGVLKVRRSNQQEQEWRRAAQLKAQRAMKACSAAILEFDEAGGPLTMLPIKLADLAKRAGAETLKPFNEKLASLTSRSNDLRGQFANLNTSANDPDADGRSVAEYNEMAAAYEPILSRLNAAQKELAAIAAEVTTLQQKLDSAPAAVEAADQAVKNAGGAIDGISTKGFKTESAQQLLAQAAAAVDQGRKALGSDDYSGALSAATTATSLATQVTTTVTSLLQTKARLDVQLSDLRARCPVVEASIAGGRKVFSVLSSTFAAESGITVQGNGTEAEKRLTAARKTIEQIAILVSMDQQQWEQAEHLITAAAKSLDDAEGLIRAIIDLQKHLDAAKLDAPKEIEAAAADLERAVAYERQYDDDIDDKVKAKLVQAAQMIKDARTELGKSQPNYLNVLAMAQKAHKAADAILDQERSEHETAERERQKAAGLLRDAERAVSTATSYVNNHRDDVDADTIASLGSAAANLEVAQAATTLRTRISASEMTLQKARDVLARAQSDFSDAEDRRERARRRAYEAQEERRQSSDLLTGVVIGSILSGDSGHRHHEDSGSWGSRHDDDSSGGSSGSFDFGGGSDGGNSGSYDSGGGSDGGNSGGW